jgi:diguanylate cyclase (GGDEF)-like protein
MGVRRLDLLVKFGLISAVAMCVLGVVLAANDRATMRSEIERATQDYSASTVSLLFQSLLQPEDIPEGPTALRALQLTGGLALAKGNGTYQQATIFNLQRKAVFSDQPSRVGLQAEVSAGLDRAFAGETARHRVSDPADEGITAPGRYLSVYVPIRFGSDPKVHGVVEVITSYAPVDAALSRNLKRIVLIAALGLGVTWLLLFRLVAGASRSLRRQARENEQLARTDALTGLPNRVRFLEEAERALPVAQRNGAWVAVMIIDLDRFKEINDALGHETGDELLRRVAPRVRDAVGTQGTVARFGGDEFAVLLPEVRSVTEACDVAEAVLEALAETIVIDDLTLVADGSVGIGLYPRHGDALETVMRSADIAMYAAKETGSGYAVYESEFDRHSPERLALLAELRDAIQSGELTVEYQPKADATFGHVTGVEALVRWDNPRRGRLSPGVFVPLAEHTGLIKPLTAHVLEVALRDCRRWLDEGIQMPVAVNLSARRLVDLRLPEEVTAALVEWGVPPEMLELEITESAIMLDHGRGATILERLHDTGIRLSIDDFGTGYSSFAHLRRLPVHGIKIDRSFVAEMDTVGADNAIVRSGLALARNLRLKVVAEGVETRRIWDQLALLGCDEVQGWELAKSMPVDELLVWLRADPERLPAQTA